MVTPSAGTVVTVRFPFSDLSNSKLRPAVILANAENGDWVLCQITSKAYADNSAIQVETKDFASSSLQRTSYARPSKIFTANESLMAAEVEKLKDDALQKITNAVIHLLQSNLPL